MVDRVKPWFMVHGFVHGFVHVHGPVHGFVHGPSDFSVSPSPLGTDLDLVLTGLGLGWVRGWA